MRSLLSDSHPEAPLLVYIGRLGMEKRLQGLTRILDENPTARLAFVGKGPYEEELRVIFKGYNVVFAGQYSGDKLSQARLTRTCHNLTRNCHNLIRSDRRTPAPTFS